MLCIVCRTILTGRQSMFCSLACKNKKHQSYKAQHDRGIARELQLVQRMGGACCVCSYRKNLGAFHFHYNDPQEREFKSDMRALSNRTWRAVLKEADKCSLICAVCHAELHNPHLDLGLLL